MLHYTQNFLHSPKLVKRIVALADLGPTDTVLEVGPGKGIITRALAEKAGRVMAVELDEQLAAEQRAAFADTPHVEVVQADILTYTPPPDLSVFSNIPFNITSHLLEHLFTGDDPPVQAHLILQVDALIKRSKYGEGETFKSLLLGPRYTIKRVFDFKPRDFTPRPGVDTALFALHRRPQPLIPVAEYAAYKDFLAYVSKDRVGEGVWKNVLPKHKLPELDYNRGLATQTPAGMAAAFRASKLNPTRGAMAALRAEQARREAINKRGGHHQSKRG